MTLIKHNNDSPTIYTLDDNDDDNNNNNNNKLQIALAHDVELKDGPAHRIHIAVFSVWRKTMALRPAVHSYAIRNLLCIQVNEFFSDGIIFAYFLVM